MMRIIVDYYPEANAFYVHVEEAGDRTQRKDPFFSQMAWAKAAQLVLRMRKHLRRVGLLDRQTIIPEAAKQLKLPQIVHSENVVGFPIKPDKRKSKW